MIDKKVDVKYPHGSAAHQMTTEVIRVRRQNTIADVIKILKKGKKFRITDYIYVLNDNDKLVGVISIDELFDHKRNTHLDKVMKKDLVTVNPNIDQEKVVHLALKHGIKAVPVVEKGTLLGVVGTKEILHTLNRSLQEDILHFAGIHKSHLQYENTLEVPMRLSIIHRIPWLIIGLIGIMFAASFISIFESILEKYLILAFFIPAIVYMSGALGTQHQTLFIRDLSVLGKELRLGYYFARQMLIAFFLGLIISILVFLGVFFFWKDVFVGFVIAASMFIALLTTSFTSLIMTLIIKKFGQDPALGSGPLATVISDITSIIIYFLIASWLL